MIETVTSSEQDEFDAMRQIVAAMDSLDQSTRDRVLRYVNDRYRPVGKREDGAIFRGGAS